MAEYIERTAVLKSLGYEENRRGDVLPGSTFDLILKEPAADMVEVVRCRECAYATRPGDNIVYCDNFERDMMPDDYCSVGERKIETVLPKSDAKDESLEADHD